MKKIFLALIVSAVVLSLSACGSSDNTSLSSQNSSAASVAVSSAQDSSTSSAAASSTGSSSENESSTSSDESSNEKSELQTVLEKVKSEVKLPDDMVDFDARRLKRVFGITEEQAADFAGAICTDGLKQDEIIFVKAKDEAAVKDIADRLQNDWQSKYNVIKNYDPDQVEIIENAKVETNGLYASLVISADAEKIKSIFNEIIK